jgi:glycosyltransferase involved in cell wall biosynthesis
LSLRCPRIVYGAPLENRPPHLLHVFSTFCAAGSQVRTAGLVNYFGPEFRHTFVACDGRTEATELLDRAVSYDVAHLSRAEGPLGGVRTMRRLLVGTKPDLLLTYNWGSMDAVLAARSQRVHRHLHHEDGFNSDEAARLKARRNFTRRVALRRTDIVVPSRTLEQIARRTWRLPRVHFIPNGVDVARFRAVDARGEPRGAAFRAELGIPAAALVIGSVGHLRAVKNFPRLVRVAAMLDPRAFGGRPVHVVIVGEGSERPAIEATASAVAPASRSSLRVHLPGHRADLSDVYAAFDVFALTSDSEQQPVSLLEAMAAGRAVVATDVGDIRATLPETARLGVVPMGPSVEHALEDAFTRLLADDAARAALGRAALDHVTAEFSLERMAAAHGALWRATLPR